MSEEQKDFNESDYNHHKARMLADWMTDEGMVVKGKDVITPIFLMLQNHFKPKPPQS